MVATAGPSNSLFFLDLSGLPTDPAELKARIESREIEGGPPGDAETFTIIADLLRETYAPPALRAALYMIAAELPGVELIGQTKDPAGRDGIAVAYANAGARHELIFDPDTSVMLGERFVVTDATKEYRVAPGTVVGWAAYLSSGIVDSTSEIFRLEDPSQEAGHEDTRPCDEGGLIPPQRHPVIPREPGHSGLR